MGCRIESFTADAFRALPPPPPFHRCIIRFGSPMRNTFHRYVLSAENTFHQFSSFISWIHFSTPTSYRKLLWVANTRHFTYKCLIEGIYFCLRGAAVTGRSWHLESRYERGASFCVPVVFTQVPILISGPSSEMRRICMPFSFLIDYPWINGGFYGMSLFSITPLSQDESYLQIEKVPVPLKTILMKTWKSDSLIGLIFLAIIIHRVADSVKL